ncbi:MAG: 3-phosphoshikimate 1-carboxyvinyltransferase [Myxococcota bacterium]
MSDVLQVRGPAQLRGCIVVPGDKSISHRAVILASLAQGDSCIEGFLPSRDCLATLRVMKQLGVHVVRCNATQLHIQGVGLTGLRECRFPLDCGGSATTMRLLAGVLSGQRFDSMLTGNSQLSRRPMARVVEPLMAMGARIDAVGRGGRSPLHIRSSRGLFGRCFTTQVASAQLKSCLLLAGLFAKGCTRVLQPQQTRQHTEHLLASMGVPVHSQWVGLGTTKHHRAELKSPQVPLTPLKLRVVGDPSSAAFFLTAALLCPNSRVSVGGVGLSSARMGLFNALQLMGGHMMVHPLGTIAHEPWGRIVAHTSALHAACFGAKQVVAAIDELPLLAVAATQARGTTVVHQADELRVKETDRIAGITQQLQKMGAHIKELPDGFVVYGPTALKGATVQCLGDHRLAMALVVAGLCAHGVTHVQGSSCIADSFPGFTACLHQLNASIDHTNSTKNPEPSEICNIRLA